MAAPVSITRIDELTPDAFTETVVRIVEPDPAWPYPNGLHTLSGAGGASPCSMQSDGSSAVTKARLN